MNTYTNKSKDKWTSEEFFGGQKLIWNSGAGFDVVTYKRKSGLLNATMAECEMKTGIMRGKVLPIEIKQLVIFSFKKWAEMRRYYDNVA